MGRKVKQELGPNQRKWVEALRSGEWEQGTSVLCNRNGAHCCLGVACRLFLGDPVEVDADGDSVWGESKMAGFAPQEVVDSLGLFDETGRGENGSALYRLNDRGHTFAQIADAIEADPHNWFTEAR